MKEPLEQLSWAAVLDAMSEAVWLVDAQSLQILHANRAGCAITQLSASSMVGESVHVLAATPQDIFRWNDPAEWAEVGVETHTHILRQDGCLLPVAQRIVQLTPKLFLLSMVDRSEQENNERELESLLVELRATLDSAADGILVCGLDGGIRAFNHKLAQMWNLPSKLLTQRNDQAVLAHMAAQTRDGSAYQRTFERKQMQQQSGSQDVLHTLDHKVIERRSAPLICRGGVFGRIFSFRDITREAAVQADLQLAAQVFASSLDAIFIADGQGKIIRSNPAFARLRQETIVGSHVHAVLEHREDLQWQRSVHQAWLEHGFWEGSCNLLRSPGQAPCLVWLSWVALRGRDGRITQSIGFLRDLTQQHKDQQRIEQLAYTDALTGLPNRLSLKEHVTRVVADEANTQTKFSVLFLDLDRFKIINDTLGHQFGDLVLQQVSERLMVCLRPKDILCRLGGDEFVIYLDKCSSEQAAGVAQRILHEMNKPFWLDEMAFSVQCSIGIAQYPEHGKTLDDLIKQADTAMYRVKEAGKGSYRFYEPEMSEELLSRVQMENALRRSIEQQNLFVHYQPLVDIRTGDIVGAEALVRWTDPELGEISPAVFISLAEESGFIIPLGRWVMEQAIREAANWGQRGFPIKVAVNVSSVEIRQASFIPHLQGLLQHYALPAHLLELELTESILLQAKGMAESMNQLAQMGIGLAIDDFGTGYSNLAYLKCLPITKLKIDKSFVKGLPNDPRDMAIVQTVLALGRALRVEVLAEGVETTLQRGTLGGLGCDSYQGFLCSPAVDTESLIQLLQSRQKN